MSVPVCAVKCPLFGIADFMVIMVIKSLFLEESDSLCKVKQAPCWKWETTAGLLEAQSNVLSGRFHCLSHVCCDLHRSFLRSRKLLCSPSHLSHLLALCYLGVPFQEEGGPLQPWPSAMSRISVTAQGSHLLLGRRAHQFFERPRSHSRHFLSSSPPCKW